MQRLEVSGAVRPLQLSLGVKGLTVTARLLFTEKMAVGGFNIFSNTLMVSHPTNPVTYKPTDRFSCNWIRTSHSYTYCTCSVILTWNSQDVTRWEKY